VATAVDQGKHRGRGAPLTLGSRQFAILAASLLMVFTTTGILTYPSLYTRYIQEFGIKHFEVQYGFRTGAVAVQSSASPMDSAWGVVWVAPDGLFAQLGVRAGDIPFAYHGGVKDMYVALQQASSGEASSFEVYNSGDAHLGRRALRRVNLPPVTK
jgi:hypothetical protein